MLETGDISGIEAVAQKFTNRDLIRIGEPPRQQSTIERLSFDPIPEFHKPRQ